ncbi:hypothetical protein TIFTF001_009966 [Ficus carica]|uniref:Uncharacterized protein n=1 Tax=Ficus carica TaxID=3494 RepID=A0AA88D423_FICCA|nr:hypothetical protein TIFTF001_009966 [Ficus carica]
MELCSTGGAGLAAAAAAVVAYLACDSCFFDLARA